jgi:hypothetical protein
MVSNNWFWRAGFSSRARNSLADSSAAGMNPELRSTSGMRDQPPAP